MNAVYPAQLRGALAEISGLLQQGHFASARLACQALLARQARLPAAIHLMGLIEAAEGNFEAAAAHFRDAISLGEAGAEILLNSFIAAREAPALLDETLAVMARALCTPKVGADVRAETVDALFASTGFLSDKMKGSLIQLVELLFLPLMRWGLARQEPQLVAQIVRHFNSRRLLTQLLFPLHEQLLDSADPGEQVVAAMLDRQPDLAEVMYAYTLEAAKQGEAELAFRRCEQALAVAPFEHAYWRTKACLLRDIDAIKEAERCFRVALALERDGSTLLDMADMFLRGFQPERAIPLLLEAQSCGVETLEIAKPLAAAYRMSGSVTEAITQTQLLVEREPDHDSDWELDLARLLLLERRFDEQDRMLANIERLQPDRVAWPWLRGEALLAQGRAAEAAVHIERARELDGKGAEPGRLALSHAFIHFNSGNLAHGWSAYRDRKISNRHLTYRSFGVPMWRGESLHGKRLVVWCEQGVADELWFGTLVAELLEQADAVAFECDPRLVSLVSRRFPPAVVFPRVVEERLPDGFIADVHTSTADVAQFLRPDLAAFDHRTTLPWPVDTKRAEEWKRRLGPDDGRLRVGISWRSIRTRWPETGTAYPSMQALATLLAVPGIRWFNLQYDLVEGELEHIEEMSGALIESFDDLDVHDDFEGQAALMSQLDLVIAPGNLPAVLAAVLGKPVACMWSSALSISWRSFGTGRMPWFANMTLFEKQHWDRWPDVLGRLASHLATLRDARQGSGVPVQSQAPRCPLSIQRVAANGRALAAPETLSPSGGFQLGNRSCALIMPIGPGHADLSKEALASLSSAAQHGMGPFEQIVVISIDDGRGRMGRSCARNKAVAQAQALGAEWLFFLDADDVLASGAFDALAPYFEQFDAVWGQIWEMPHDGSSPVLRAGQAGAIASVQELIALPATASVQMGHFVRTSAAVSHPFSEKMDIGEDFDYYLRVWDTYRCTKIDRQLFVNRRGKHSSGPRSADGLAWRFIVDRLMQRFGERMRARKSWIADGKYTVVVAHPDDEVLWFGPLIANARQVIVCYTDYERKPELGRARRALAAEYPLKNIRFMDLAEPDSCGFGQWDPPRLDLAGIYIADPAAQARYRDNFTMLVERLRPALRGEHHVFTHNPWGEYGHEDHVQVGKAVHAAAGDATELWVPLDTMDRAQALMSATRGQIGPETMLLDTDVETCDALKALYQRHQCWTWPEEESLSASHRYGQWLPTEQGAI